MEQLHAQIRLVDELGKKVIAILQDYDQSFPYAQMEVTTKLLRSLSARCVS